MSDFAKIFVGLFAAAVIIAALMIIIPIYSVWTSGLDGEAKLKSSIQTKQIIVQQAQAEKDSAQLRADAIKIMGEAAKSYPEYRQQEFMASFGEALKEGNIQQIVYVPTEAMIPIMEAYKK